MKRKLIALATMIALLLPALPAQAGSATFNPPGITCIIGKTVHLRFTVSSGSIILRTNAVGVSNGGSFSPTSNWTTSSGTDLPPYGTYTYNTGWGRAHSTTTNGATSWIRFYTATGQPAPTFSWIGWVCI